MLAAVAALPGRPVFVDPSGRRYRLVITVAAATAALVVAVLVTLAVALLAPLGPTGDAAPLPAAAVVRS